MHPSVVLIVDDRQFMPRLRGLSSASTARSRRTPGCPPPIPMNCLVWHVMLPGRTSRKLIGTAPKWCILTSIQEMTRLCAISRRFLRPTAFLDTRRSARASIAARLMHRGPSGRDGVIITTWPRRDTEKVHRTCPGHVMDRDPEIECTGPGSFYHRTRQGHGDSRCRSRVN